MERYNGARRDVWKPLCILFAALLALTWVFFGVLYSNGKVSFSTLETPEQKQTAHGGAVIGESVGSGIELMSEKIEPKAYAENGVSAQADTAYTLTATITPDNATNKAVDWTVSFVNPASAWASGKSVTDYVTVTPTSDGALTANVECLQEFGEQIEVSVSSRENAKATASCTVDYARRVTDTALLRSDNVTYLKNFGESEVLIDLVVPAYEDFAEARKNKTVWCGDYTTLDTMWGEIPEGATDDPEMPYFDEFVAKTYRFSDYTLKDNLIVAPETDKTYAASIKTDCEVNTDIKNIFVSAVMETVLEPTPFSVLFPRGIEMGNNPFAILLSSTTIPHGFQFTEELYNKYMGEFVTWFHENPDTPIATFTRTITGKYSAYTETYTFRYNPATVKMPVNGVALDKDSVVL